MEYKNLSEIKLLDMNPRKISDSQFKILCKSIQDNISYFEARPIILSDRTGEFIVIAGNQRYKAAKHLKLKKVPIYLMKDLSLEQEKEIVIRDNISNGDWDWDILNTGAWGEISDLEEWGLEMPKFVGIEEGTDGFTLPDGDKAPFQQMTFTLADEQAVIIKNAIDEIKGTDEYKYAETMGNENSNGNALYLIVASWAGQRI